MRRALKHFLTSTLVGRYLLMPYRLRIAFAHILPIMAQAVTWTLRRRELSNFTYPIHTRNKRYLAFLVAQMFDVREETVFGYIEELDQDEELRKHVRSIVAQSPARYTTDVEHGAGKRYVYYVLARVCRPQVVVEAGTDKGYGTCVLARALRRNDEEGFPGRVYSVDLSSEAGLLVQGEFTRYATLIQADVERYLAEFEGQIDFFIHDTIAVERIEQAEYDLLITKLAPSGIVYSSWHETTALMKFARTTKRHYLVFKDEPVSHWYPGSSIGLAYPVMKPR
jgi:predicted O-methyltransferase YrrM